MTNDNDIVKGNVPPYMNDTLRLFYAELQEGETDYPGMLSRLAVIIDSKARADNAKQIFAELDPIIQVLDVNDQNCLKIIIAVQALKKRYKVD